MKQGPATVRYESGRPPTYYVDCAACSPDRHLTMYQGYARGSSDARRYARDHNAVVHKDAS